MALTSDETQAAYRHLRVAQVAASGDFVGGVPVLTEFTHQLQSALDNLTANGEAVVRTTLDTLEVLWLEMVSVKTRFQATKLEGIELNPKEWDDRRRQYEFFRGELAATLGVEHLLSGGAGAGLLYREP